MTTTIEQVLSGAQRWHIEQGDSAVVAKSIPDCSIDAIVADPPAGIAFMGKTWDEDKGGEAEWIAWLAGILAEGFRVLKPGGYCLLWALPRTSDWTMQALRRAGFEVRDVVTHLFGCLSEDTEILVDGEWVPYQKAAVGRLAMCYDVDRDEYFWGPIQETFEYAYADTAYRIRSAGTDQIVSRGHRCIVERDGIFGFERAEDVARERSARVPVLEGLPDLLRDLPVSHEGVSGTRGDVRSSVRGTCDGGEDDGRASEACSDVRNVRRGVPTEGQSCSEQSQVLHYEVRSGGSNEQARRSGAAPGDSADGARGLDRCEPGDGESQDERSRQSRLEGRGDSRPQARELRVREVRSMPAGVPEHGAEGRLRDGASPLGRTGDGAHVDPSGDGSPHGSQPDEQRACEPAPLRDEPRSQAVRGARYTRSDLATIEPVRYDGVVWCVRVSTGAFVARRNGKVFVTGNSGFPKSLDVSKAIDAAAGAEREVIGVKSDPRYLSPRTNSPNHMDRANGVDGGHGADSKAAQVTAPATPEARRWSGFGTAIKPAAEFWILARKPLDGTVAANVLRHGTGALNIDAARVGTDVVGWGGGGRGEGSWNAESCGMKEGEARPVVGRFPANLVLSHTAWEETHCPCGAVLSFVARFCPECGSGAVTHRRAGCCAVGERRVSSESGGPKFDSMGFAGGGNGTEERVPRHTDGLETVTAWECLATCACGLSTLAPSGGAPPRCRCGRAMAWACAVARLDEQSGDCRSTLTGRADPSISHAHPGTVQNCASIFGVGGAQANVYADAGGASRFFNTFAPPDDIEPYFWQAKPSAAETEAGCEALPLKSAAENVDREPGTKGASNPRSGAGREQAPMLKLRADLTPEQRAFVLAELSRRGVAL